MGGRQMSSVSSLVDSIISTFISRRRYPHGDDGCRLRRAAARAPPRPHVASFAAAYLVCAIIPLPGCSAAVDSKDCSTNESSYKAVVYSAIVTLPVCLFLIYFGRFQAFTPYQKLRTAQAKAACCLVSALFLLFLSIDVAGSTCFTKYVLVSGVSEGDLRAVEAAKCCAAASLAAGVVNLFDNYDFDGSGFMMHSVNRHQPFGGGSPAVYPVMQLQQQPYYQQQGGYSHSVSAVPQQQYPAATMPGTIQHHQQSWVVR